MLVVTNYTHRDGTWEFPLRVPEEGSYIVLGMEFSYGTFAQVAFHPSPEPTMTEVHSALLRNGFNMAIKHVFVVLWDDYHAVELLDK